MYKYGDYLYDPERLLLYKSEVSEAAIKTINTEIPNDNMYEKNLSYISKFNYDKMNMNKIALSSFGICLTNNCNMRCNYCSYSSTNSDTNRLEIDQIEIFVKDMIKKHMIKKIVSKKNEDLAVIFTGGGEPTYEWNLLKNAVELIKRLCAKKNISVFLRLTSNGMLSSEQIEYISKNFNTVMISYDGLPEIQNSNRTSPICNDTNSVVERTISELANRRVPLNIRATVWQKDFNKLKEIYNHIISLVPENSEISIGIHPVMFEGRASNLIKRKEQTQQKDDLTYKDLVKYYVDLVEHIIATKGKHYLKTLDNSIFDVEDNTDIFCGAYDINHLWLLPDKTIQPCIEYRDGKVIVGKISNGKINYYNKYSNSYLKVSQEKAVECRNCIAYRFCKGGCPVWHLRFETENFENKNIEPPECHLHKEYWYYVLNAVLSGKYSFGWSIKKIDLHNASDQIIYKLVREGS